MQNPFYLAGAEKRFLQRWLVEPARLLGACCPDLALQGFHLAFALKSGMYCLRFERSDLLLAARRGAARRGGAGLQIGAHVSSGGG